MELCSYFVKLPGNFFELPVSSSSPIVTSTLVWCIAWRSSSIFSWFIPTPRTECPPRAMHKKILRNVLLNGTDGTASHGTTRTCGFASSRDGFLCVRSYLAGGGRGEKMEGGGNGSALHTLRTLGMGIGALTTSARKNQNGTRKAKTRPSTGCVTAISKAIATHRITTSRDAK